MLECNIVHYKGDWNKFKRIFNKATGQLNGIVEALKKYGECLWPIMGSIRKT